MIAILKWDGDNNPVFIGSAVDVSNFGYFQRATVREGIMFAARTIVGRTQPGMRQTVKNAEYLCHVHVKDYGLAGIVVADQDYPTVAAFSIIGKVLDDFMEQGGGEDAWRSVEADSTLANPVLDPALVKYQVGLLCGQGWGNTAGIEHHCQGPQPRCLLVVGGRWNTSLSGR